MYMQKKPHLIRLYKSMAQVLVKHLFYKKYALSHTKRLKLYVDVSHATSCINSVMSMLIPSSRG